MTKLFVREKGHYELPIFSLFNPRQVVPRIFYFVLYCLSPWQINVFPKKQYNLNFTYLFNLTYPSPFFLIMNYINEKSAFSCFEFRFTLRECQRKFFLHSPVFVISFVILTSISVIQNMQPCIYMKYFPEETL